MGEVYALTYLLITLIALLNVIAAILAAVAFNQLGWGRIGLNLCLGLSLGAIYWVVTDVVLEHISGGIFLINLSLACKFAGMLFMCNGFRLLYLSAKGQW
jgi:hypothetical protein